MRAPAEPISPGQYLMMVAISVVAGGVYLWPAYLVRAGGADALWGLLLTTAAAMGLSWLQTLWGARTRAATLAQVLARTWGKAGMILGLGGTMAWCLALDGCLLSLYGDMLKEFYYPFTPAWFTTLCLMAMAGWIAAKSLSGVARNVQFWFPLVILSVAVVIASGLPNTHHWRAALPAPTLYVAPIGRAALGTWFLYVNGGVTMTLSAHVRHRGQAQTAPLALYAIAFQGFMLLVLYVVVVSTLGPAAVAELRWPIIYVFSLITVRSFFVKGLGAFIVITWTVAMVLYQTVHLFCATWNLQMAFRWRPEGRPALVAAMGIAVWGVSLAIPSDVAAHQLIFSVINPYDLAWVALLTVASLIRWLLFPPRRRPAP
ncbi:MAG: spore germination protein [Firmicutes bacterium]|nr:GerAB/ArcD/ProY family transporter [Alicyclobacillaceae bacterium]MCL6496255.1 spore germination protein [Bacillota bacterium]